MRKNTTKLINITDETFQDYKKPAIYLAFPYCSMKCEGCQNKDRLNDEVYNIENDAIIDRYLNNKLTSAFVFGGLEPLDSFGEVLQLVKDIRSKTDDTIVIYTGYMYGEVTYMAEKLLKYNNTIIKFGRYLPNSTCFVDSYLGVEIASSNQYTLTGKDLNLDMENND